MHDVSDGDGGTRLADTAHNAKRKIPCTQEKGCGLVRCTALVLGRNSRREPMRMRGCASVESPEAKFGWKTGFARKCADDGRAEAGERQPVPGAAC